LLVGVTLEGMTRRCGSRRPRSHGANLDQYQSHHWMPRPSRMRN